MEPLQIGQFEKHQTRMVGSGYSPNSAAAIIRDAVCFIEQQPFVGYKREEHLFQQGQQAMAFFILRHGCVLTSEGSRGKTFSQLTTPITFLGDDVFAGSREYSHSAQALTDCIVQPVATVILRCLTRNNPALGFFFFINHVVQTDRQNKRMKDFMFKDVMQKTASVLIEIIKASKEYPLAYLPHHVIGDMVGSTRESVHKALKELSEGEIFSWKRGSKDKGFPEPNYNMGALEQVSKIGYSTTSSPSKEISSAAAA